MINQLETQDDSARQTVSRFDEQIKQQGEIILGAEKAANALSKRIEELEKIHREQTGERDEAENKLRGISEQIKRSNEERMNVIRDIDVLKEQIKNIEGNRKMLLENSGGFKQAMTELDDSDREIREKIERVKREIERSNR